MVAERIGDFEDSMLLMGIGNNCSQFPYGQLSDRLRAKLASENDRILQFFVQNEEFLNRPYGYDLMTKGGNPRYKDDWRELNLLAMHMRALGFNAFQNDLSSAFSDCLYQAELISGPEQNERIDWAFGLAQSAAALFTVHVLNIYRPQKGLFANMIDANVQLDALGRTNYKPAISAIAKAVKKSLGWKGDACGSDECRAEMIISLVEQEQRDQRAILRTNRGIDFERECARVLADAGFEVRGTPATGDFGADLIAEKDGLTFAIQCKDLSKPVGVKGVQESIGARRHYTADFACVCANSGFTEAALELAATNRVITTSCANLAASLERAH